MKRAGLIALAAGLVLLGLWWGRRSLPAGPAVAGAPTPAVASTARPAPPSPARESVQKTDTSANGFAATADPAAERSHLADDLNASGGTLARDLQILEAVLGAWQTNFPHTGNPVGENAEITVALTGENALHLALIPREHPAINARGELCDRWGTPFFFHQLGARRMELRSAGPDRRLYTSDDAVLTPAE